MIWMPGDDQFTDRFDWYKWSAPIYETPQEALEAINHHNIVGKKIENIRVIGHTSFRWGFNENPIHFGIDLGSSDDPYKDYPYYFNSPVPARIEFHEPIIFEFTDGSSMEIEYLSKAHLRIGFDSIPKTITDGQNHSNFDAGVFFKDFYCGQRIERIEYEEKQNWRYSINDRDVERKTEKYDTPAEFRMDNVERSWIIKFQNYNEFRYDRSGFFARDGDIDYVQRSIAEQATHPQKQIEIGVDEYWFSLAQSKAVQGKTVNGIPYKSIGIDECAFLYLLFPFLKKQYLPSLQSSNERHDDPNNFDWYGRNDFTIDGFRLFLSDVKNACQMLQDKPDDPSVQFLRGGIARCFVEDDVDSLTEEDWPVIVDFYKRFCYEAENLIELHPEYDRLLVTGP